MKLKIKKIKERGHVFDVVVDAKGNDDPDEFEHWTFDKSKLKDGKWKKEIKKAYKDREEKQKGITKKMMDDIKVLEGSELDTEK